MVFYFPQVVEILNVFVCFYERGVGHGTDTIEVNFLERWDELLGD